MAIVEVGVWPGAMEQYVLDFTTNRLFAPTLVGIRLLDNPNENYNAALMPYEYAENDKGYLFARTSSALMNTMFKVNFAGTGRMDSLRGLPVGVHGPSVPT
jgi:hypothetical protein